MSNFTEASLVILGLILLWYFGRKLARIYKIGQD